MTDAKVLLVGPLPRARQEGVSTAFRDLVTGMDPTRAEYFNTNWLRDVKNPGRLDLGRVLESLVIVGRVLINAWRYKSVYLILSTSQLGFMRDAFTVLAAKFWRRRVVGHLHGGGMRSFYLDSNRLQRWLIRIVFDQFDAVIVLGEKLRGQFRFVRHSDRLLVVPNGLPTQVAAAAPIHGKELSEPLQLLYLSNLTPAKGILDLLRATAELASRTPVVLHVCGAILSDVDSGAGKGDAQFKAEIDKLIDDLGLQDRVVLHGTVTGTDKIDMLRRCHIFILPTYYRWEGQPLSIIEAQAYAMPVVTTVHRAIPETVRFGVSAEICKKRNPASIVAAIERITESEQVYHSYSMASRENYTQRFRPEVHIENMKRVLYEN